MSPGVQGSDVSRVGAPGWLRWPTASARKPLWLDLGVVGLLTLIGLALRLHRLGDQNVWWDEGYSVYLARKDLVSLAVETAGDVHPPMHYWFLHVWTRLVGESEFAVRYSSVWFGVVGICLAYWLGKRLFGQRVGIATALLLATSRFHVEWSQQIRMYTLTAIVVMLSIALTLQLWEAPRRRLWLSYAAVTTFGLYTLYLSALVPLVESLVTALLVVLPVGGRRLSLRFLARWVAVGLVCLALYAPWIAIYLGRPHVTPIPTHASHISLGTFLQAIATTFPIGISAYLDRYTPITLAALGLLALAAPAMASNRFRRAGALLGALLLVPPLVVYALSFPNPVYYSPNLSVRYLLIFIPAYHLLLASALCFLWRSVSLDGQGGQIGSGVRRWLAPRLPPLRLGRGADDLDVRGQGVSHGGAAGRAEWRPQSVLRALPGAVGMAFLAGVVVWSLADYYPTRRLVDDYQTVVRHLEAHALPDDAIVLNSDRDWPIFLYYYAGDLARYGVGSLQPISQSGAAELLAPILARHKSVWLLTSDNAYDSDPHGHVPTWLGKHTRPAGGVANSRRRLTLYTTDADRTVGVPSTVRPMGVTNAVFGGDLVLVGYDLSVSEVAPGEDLRLALYWRAPSALPPDTHVAIRLFDRYGVLYRDVRAPISAEYPPARWQPGQVVRADYVTPVPKAMPAGSYSLAVAVVAAGRELPVAGPNAAATLRVIGVVGGDGHRAGRPSPQRHTDLSLGSAIRLAGYDLALVPDQPLSSGVPARADLEPGMALRVRLYWETAQALDRPYTVFVQLVGQTTNPATGNPLWAQRDTYPQDGRRPTDDWVPGEVIVDEHELVVPSAAPAGRYYVQVGLYDLTTGRRLAVADRGKPAGDSVVIFEGQLSR